MLGSPETFAYFAVHRGAQSSDRSKLRIWIGSAPRGAELDRAITNPPALYILCL